MHLQKFLSLFCTLLSHESRGCWSTNLIRINQIVPKQVLLGKTNSHCTIVSLDFTKAFDTIRHSAFATKLAKKDIPNSIHNWITSFLQSAATSLTLGSSLRPGASIVQGSGIGPTAYNMSASNLILRTLQTQWLNLLMTLIY